MANTIFPYSSCIALTPQEARQGLEFVFQAWLCFHKRHNAEITAQNEFHPDILERYLISYRDIQFTKVLGDHTFYLTDRTAAALHDAILATWVMVGQATLPEDWNPMYPAHTPPFKMFARWHELGIKVPPFPMADLSPTLFVHAYRDLDHLRDTIHQIQFWAIMMRELARLYACYMRTPGWERYCQSGIQNSLAIQNIMYSSLFSEYLEALVEQNDFIDEDFASDSTTTESSISLPPTPQSLPPPPPIPEGSVPESHKEYALAADLFPFAQIIEELSLFHEEAAFPTLDPVPVMPMTYSVPPLDEYKPYPQDLHNCDNASGPLLSEDEVKEEASEDSHSDKENMPLPGQSNFLPPIPPIPTAWITWDRGIGNVRHKCNTVVYCAYCAWVEETGLDVVDPLNFYVNKGRLWMLTPGKPLSRDVTDEVMAGSKALDNYYLVTKPIGGLLYPEPSPNPSPLSRVINIPTFEVRPQTPRPPSVIYISSSGSSESLSPNSSNSSSPALSTHSSQGYSEMEASARRIINWLQNPEQAISPDDLNSVLPVDGVVTPLDFNSLPFEVDQDAQQILAAGHRFLSE
ncbi:hypothetical protein RSAG8_13298, partial [Rhizoctonia solani AG-8 WAC10335]